MTEAVRRVTPPPVSRRLDALQYLIDSLSAHNEETHGNAFRERMAPLVSALSEFWNCRQTLEGSDLDTGQYLAAVDAMRDVVVKLSASVILTPVTRPNISKQ